MSAALWQLGDLKAAVDLLVKTDRKAGAALMTRTYAPRYAAPSDSPRHLQTIFNNRIPSALHSWRVDLESKGQSKAANLLADPSRGQDAEMFEEEWEEAVEREQQVYGRDTNGVDVGPVL